MNTQSVGRGALSQWGFFASLMCHPLQRVLNSATQYLLFCLPGCIGMMLLLQSAAYSAQSSADGFAFETVVSGLTLPTTAAFHPDGRIFIAQKNGVVRVVENGSLLDAPVVELTDVNTWGDRGLIGLAIDPDVQRNGYLYLAYTYENNAADRGAAKTARVVRLSIDGNTAVAGSQTIILGSVGGTAARPSCADYAAGADCIPSDSISHTVGGLRFGLDGKLYVATGDGAGFDRVDPNAFRAQDLETLSGKILRIEKDGRAVVDNPFYTGNPDDIRSKIWANGFRNPYRFNFHPQDGRLLGGDVGWSGREEINHVVSGGNYGWPCREGSTLTTGYAALPECDVNYDLLNPIYEYNHIDNSGAITAGSVAGSNSYPPWLQGRYVYADFAMGTIHYLTLNDQSQVSEISTLTNAVAGPVDIITGPDGLIYYLSIHRGELRRLVYAGPTDAQVPLVQASYATANTSPLTATFSAAGSSDPNGGTLQYLWQFGDGNTGTGERPTHTYAGAGTYTVTLTATASGGLAVTTSISVSVTDEQIADSQPFVVSVTSLADPMYLGSLIPFRAVIGNTVSGEPFSVVFEIFDGDGQPVDSIRLESVHVSEGETVERDISWFAAKEGPYTISVGFYRTNSNHLLQSVNASLLEFSVVARSPVEPKGAGVINLLNLLALLLLTRIPRRPGYSTD